MLPHYRTGNETIEIAARRHLFAAAPPAYGCTLISVPGTPATLMSVLAMPAPTMNRVLGLAGDAPLSAPTLDWIRREFRQRGMAQFWITAWDTPDSATLRDSLLALGCRPQGAWAKCEYARPLARPPACGRVRVRVRRALQDEYRLAGEILHTSFGTWPALIPWMAALAGRPAWQVFFACDDDGVPFATGALLVDGAHGWLGMGATLPHARRRGAQQALLAARLQAASVAGCATVSVEAEAGASSGSLNNILRAGFRQLGTRLNYLCES